MTLELPEYDRRTGCRAVVTADVAARKESGLGRQAVQVGGKGKRSGDGLWQRGARARKVASVKREGSLRPGSRPRLIGIVLAPTGTLGSRRLTIAAGLVGQPQDRKAQPNFFRRPALQVMVQDS